KPVRLNVSDGSKAGAATPKPGAGGGASKPAATVPDVTGMTLAQARSALQQAGIRVAVRQVPSNEAAGTVVAQAQPAGAPIPASKQMLITVSTGQKPGQGTGAATTVPDIKGLTVDAAKAKLKDAGIVGELRQVPSIEPAGTV